MVDAPENIGLVRGMLGLRLWNKHDDNDQSNAIAYTRSDLVAELAAENERLRNMLDGYGKLDAELAIAERRIEALASTGAVKVKVDDLTLIRGIVLPMVLERSREPGDAWDKAASILSALEPHPRATSTVDAHETANMSDKPEGQQEPVTEAMVVAATEEYFAASFKNTPSDAMRIALKAAMEAGG